MNFLVPFADVTVHCEDLTVIIRLIKILFNLIQFAVPIALILFGAIDLGKAVMASKEDEMKKAQQTLIKRIIYAVLIFFIVFIVKIAIGLVSQSQSGDKNAADTTTWADCWNEVS